MKFDFKMVNFHGIPIEIKKFQKISAEIEIWFDNGKFQEIRCTNNNFQKTQFTNGKCKDEILTNVQSHTKVLLTRYGHFPPNCDS